jgi:predicted AAA+ superfamily ATPase
MNQNITNRLVNQNPWWAERKVPADLVGQPRSIDLARLLDYREIKVITGVRRSGKSTLLFQTINHLINKGIAPDNILLLNFDFDSFRGITLDDLFKGYLEASGAPPTETHIFLDEVHFRDDWQRWVRRLYDMREVKQIFITDSSSRLLSGEYAKILTGRIITKILYPLSFKEFLTFKGIVYEPRYITLKSEAAVKRSLREFMQYGGFPEVVQKDEYGKQLMLKEYFSNILHKDIGERFRVNQTKISEVAEYLLSCFSSPVSLRAIRNNFGVGVGTASKYTAALEEVFLYSFLRKYSPSLKTQIKDIKKVYCIDAGIINTAGFNLSENIGRVAENTVYLELKRRQQQNPSQQLYYHRDQQQKEVDFVVKENLKIRQLIQVCWSTQDQKTEKREAEAILKAGRQLKCANLLIITEDEEKTEKTNNTTINYTPLWKWLIQK